MSKEQKEKKNKKEKNVDVIEDTVEQLEKNEVDDTVNEFKALTTKVSELEDKLIRNQAELQNFKRRKDEETMRLLKYCNEDLVSELITVLDNFDRALTVETNEQTAKYLEGFRMVDRQLTEILNKFEVKEIECLGKPFDPMYHQSVMVTKDATKASGTVLEVLQKGYMLKDKVIRPAMVRVNE